MLYYKNNQWHFCQLKVTYSERGNQITKFTNDKQWWLNFNENWPHVNNLQFEYIEPTQRQKDRLGTVNDQNMSEGWISYACEFVENGRILKLEDGSVPQPFQGITEDPDLDKMKSEKINSLRQDNNKYILSYYDRESQVSLQAIYNDPDSNQTQRDCCKAVFDWIKSILGYYYQKKVAIRDNTETISELENVTWDFPGNFDVLKPAHTLESIVNEAT